MPVVSFYFNEMSTTDIYTLSLHDALPIWARGDRTAFRRLVLARFRLRGSGLGPCTDRGSKPTQLAFPAEPRRAVARGDRAGRVRQRWVGRHLSDRSALFGISSRGRVSRVVRH